MTEKLMKMLCMVFESRKLPWIIIFIGITLRVVPYLLNRSLWLDETHLALNIIDRSYPELLQPLSYEQGAPFGFLIAEKVMSNVFGSSEYSLRFLPLLAGVLSVFLFYQLSNRVVGQAALLIGLGLFCVSKSLIYYSSEVKQYSIDVAVALMLYYVTIRLQSRKLSAGLVVVYGIIGGISLWFSHPAVFVLAGCAVASIYSSVKEKDLKRMRLLCVTFAIWGMNFITFYLISLHRLSKVGNLQSFWSAGFAPFPPMSKGDIRWYIDTFFNVIDDPGGVAMHGLAAFAFVVGCSSLFKTSRDRFYLLIVPSLVTLLASGLHKYPFSGRLILFLVPSLLLCIGEGAARILETTRSSSRTIGASIVVILFLNPLITAASDVTSPYHEETRSALQYIAKNRQQGDVLYLYFFAGNPFTYYRSRCKLNDIICVMGERPTKEWHRVGDDLSRLKGRKRVWVLMLESQEKIGVSVDKLYLYHLDNLGKRLDTFKARGAAVYLYDLADASSTPSSAGCRL